MHVRSGGAFDRVVTFLTGIRSDEAINPNDMDARGKATAHLDVTKLDFDATGAPIGINGVDDISSNGTDAGAADDSDSAAAAETNAHTLRLSLGSFAEAATHVAMAAMQPTVHCIRWKWWSSLRTLRTKHIDTAYIPLWTPTFLRLVNVDFHVELT